VIRSIVGLRRDEVGTLTVELSCGHVRRVDDANPGSELDCPVCEQEAGGESACFAHLVCPECGAVLDGGPHVAGCRSQ
jgi:hypothetical protein